MAGLVEGPLSTVSNVKINGSGSVTSYESAVGSMIGSFRGNEMVECSSSVPVNARNGDAGGLVGYFEGQFLKDSSASGRVEGGGAGHGYGGLVGYLISGAVSGCSASGEVVGDYGYAGGFVGQVVTDEQEISAPGATFEDCIAFGKVTGSSSVGGFVGREKFFSTFTNCHATGNVTGTESFVGGFSGESEFSISTYVGCSASGEVVCREGSKVGGFSGYAPHNTEFIGCRAEGKVIGESSVGGFSGYFSGKSITRCYATGDVELTDSRGGGLVGYFSDTKIEQSYARGYVFGNSYVGGLVGHNYRGTVEQCYSTGPATGADSGGLVGVDQGIVKESYYNRDTSGKSDTNKGIPKSTSEMRDKATYVNWDFTDCWDINTAINNGYPFLRDNESTESDPDTVDPVDPSELPETPLPEGAEAVMPEPVGVDFDQLSPGDDVEDAALDALLEAGFTYDFIEDLGDKGFIDLDEKGRVHLTSDGMGRLVDLLDDLEVPEDPEGNSLPLFRADLKVPGATAVVFFEIPEGFVGKDVDRLQAVKVRGSEDAQLFDRVYSLDDLADGCSAIVEVKNGGMTVLGADKEIGENCLLALAITDGSEFDLDGKPNKIVIDPAFIVEVDGKAAPDDPGNGGGGTGSSGGGGGGCSTFGGGASILLLLLPLAALAFGRK